MELIDPSSHELPTARAWAVKHSDENRLGHLYVCYKSKHIYKITNAGLFSLLPGYSKATILN